MCETITVALYGASGTGRKTLAAALRGLSYVRPGDKKAFAYDAFLAESEAGSTPMMNLVTVDATNHSTFSQESLDSARLTTRPTIFVYNKIDLIPRDYSIKHKVLLHINATIAFYHNCPCEAFAVSSATGEGMDDLAAHIANTCFPRTPTRMELFQHNSRKLYAGFHTVILDLIARCFALPCQRQTHNVESELLPLGTEDGLRLCGGDISTAWHSTLAQRLRVKEQSYYSIHRVSPSLLVKEMFACSSSERTNMQYVLENTSIPVPRVHSANSPHLVMDYIDGEMLLECWDRLCAFMQFRVACTMRLYVNQLRALRPPHPEYVGALGSGRVAGIFFGEKKYGPFGSVRPFQRFCDFVAATGWDMAAHGALSAGPDFPIPRLPRSDFDWTPTFVHGDLNLSNLMLGTDGALWIIDWEHAGFYPPCLEAASMRHNDEVEWDHTPRSWIGWRRFIAGPLSDDQINFWEYVYTAIHRFSSVPSP